MRRVRGDGNCFLTGFLFGYFESVILQRDQTERDRLLRRIDDIKTNRMPKRYPDSTVCDDFVQPIVDVCSQILASSDPLTPTELTAVFRDDERASYMIYGLRMVTCAEIQWREDHFMPFIMVRGHASWDRWRVAPFPRTMGLTPCAQRAAHRSVGPNMRARAMTGPR